MMSGQDNVTPQDENEQSEFRQNHVMAERREKLKAIRSQGVAFPNDFRPGNLAANLHKAYGEQAGEAFDTQAVKVSIAGRMMLKRVMGKASFATVQDRSGRIQLFIARDNVDEDVYEAFKKC